MGDLQYSKQDISETAKFQKLMCWWFLAAAACSFFSRIAALGIAVMTIYYMYRLAKALKVRRPWLYILGAFIPIISIIMVVRVIVKATNVLRAHNIKVGLMGANKTDLATFLSSA